MKLINSGIGFWFMSHPIDRVIILENNIGE